MRALVVGAGGQVGLALAATAPSNVELILVPHAVLDITDRQAVTARVAEIAPDIVFNAAAYTAVDKAETEPQTAHLINEEAAGWLAGAARQQRARFVHLSTDFVFDGTLGRPYVTGDTPNPLNVYGRSKWQGERAVNASEGNALIVRTAWVYSTAGRNFVLTMLRLMAQRDRIEVVCDQIGSPTYALNLANALWTLTDDGATGTFHYTDSGVASWYDFAVAIQEEALALSLVERTVPILPIRTEDYPTPARRPSYSVLDCTPTWRLLGEPAPHWRVSSSAHAPGVAYQWLIF